MNAKTAIKELQAYIRKLKKKPASVQIRKAIERAKALMAYYKGIATTTIAQVFNLSERTIKEWIKKFSRDGLASLYDEERSGRPRKLSTDQETELKQMIVDQNQRVWTARHVYQLILTTTGVCFSVKYLPQLLRQIGLSFHQTLYDLVKRDSEKRRQWVEEKLPEIYRRQLKEGWRVFYQDEVGFSREGTLAKSWGIKGGKNKIPNYGRGKKINLIGVFELGTGNFYGELEEDSVNGGRFKEFIWSLKKRMGGDKIILICDNAKFHKSQELQEWYPLQESWLSVEFLPAYSPDFNPIERLWKWFKGEFTHNRCWKTNGLLLRDLQNIIQNLNEGKYDLTPIMKKENERFQHICDYYETEFQQPFQTAA
jgi:transposase